MGKINQGVYGGLSGKTGNLIGASWKGINYLRIKPSKVRNPRTLLQQMQRSKFSLILGFLKPLLNYLNEGLKTSSKVSPINLAMSLNLPNAIKGEFPAYEIDYEKVVLSNGPVTEAENSDVNSLSPGEVTITWDDNSGDGLASATDKAMIGIYNPTLKRAVVSVGGLRSETHKTVNMPLSYSGATVHVWISFLNDSGEVSDSAYAGSVEVF